MIRTLHPMHLLHAACVSLRRSRPLRTVVGTLIALAVTFAHAAAAPPGSLDPLDRPAVAMKDPSRNVLLSITATGSRLVAVGASGAIIRSEDQGATWLQAPCPTSVTLTSVAFVNGNVGWAVGHSGVILATRDGGISWSRQFDGRFMLAALQRQLAETPPSNGAQREAMQQMIDDGPDKPLLEVLALSPTRVLAVGAYGLLLWSEDEGNHWSVRLDLTLAAKGKHLYAVRPLGRTLIFAGEAGTLGRTTDFPAELIASAAPYSGSFFGLVTAANGGMIAYGLRGHAVASTDTGRTWSAIDTGVTTSINAGLLLSDGRILLGTDTGDILVSQDSGTSFRALPGAIPEPIAGLAETSSGFVAIGARGVVHMSSSAARATQRSERLEGLHAP
jgi:photosystem II stability/assembly factor-like uncharacterized protein